MAHREASGLATASNDHQPIPAPDTGSSSVRVYEIAKVLQVEPDQIIRLLHAAGAHYVKNHMSAVHASDVARLRRRLDEERPGEDDPPQVAKPRAPARTPHAGARMSWPWPATKMDAWAPEKRAAFFQRYPDVAHLGPLRRVCLKMAPADLRAVVEAREAERIQTIQMRAAEQERLKTDAAYAAQKRVERERKERQEDRRWRRKNASDLLDAFAREQREVEYAIRSTNFGPTDDYDGADELSAVLCEQIEAAASLRTEFFFARNTVWDLRGDAFANAMEHRRGFDAEFLRLKAEWDERWLAAGVAVVPPRCNDDAILAHMRAAVAWYKEHAAKAFAEIFSATTDPADEDEVPAREYQPSAGDAALAKRYQIPLDDLVRIRKEVPARVADENPEREFRRACRREFGPAFARQSTQIERRVVDGNYSDKKPVTLWRPSEPRTELRTDAVALPSAKRASANERFDRRVLRLLAKHQDGLSMNEVQKRLRAGRPQVARSLERLTRACAVMHVRIGNDSRFIRAK